MGNRQARSEEELSETLEECYQLQAHAYLLHRQSNQLCTLHKITTNSAGEAQKIQQILEEYQLTKCESISKLREHYHLDNAGYCSDQQNFYLIFQGQNNYTLREEYAKRRFHNHRFTEQEIGQIIETYLCGLREYNHRFQRTYERVALESVVIDIQTRRLYLKDPWLNNANPQHENTDTLTNLLLNYPSPQKLNAAYASKFEPYSEFFSDLFSIGVIALQINQLQFVDSIYSRKREINFQQITLRLQQFRSDKLKRGIGCLLDRDPNERKKIYQIWGIQNKQPHFLTCIKENSQPILNPSNSSRSRVPQTSEEARRRIQHPNSHYPIQNNAAYLAGQSIRPADPIWIKASNKEHANSSIIQRGSGQIKIFEQFRGYQQNNANSNSTKISFSNNIPVQPPSLGYSPPSNSTYWINFQKNYTYVPKIESLGIKNAPLGQSFPKLDLIHQSYLDKASQKIQKDTINDKPSPVSNHSDNTFLLNQNTKNYFQKLQSEAFSKKNVHLDPEINRPFFSYDAKIHNQLLEGENLGKIEKKEQELKSITAGEVVKPLALTQIKANIKIKQILKNQKQNENQRPKDLEPTKYLDINSTKYQKSQTPLRPTVKNKYNSTIVEVRDEDTPDNSEKEQPLQDEYVFEEYQTGSRYEGFKSNGMRNGRGKFYYQDGGYYEGQWKNNKMDGWGKLYYEGGKLAYEGYWQQDQFNGLGKVYNDNPLKLAQGFDYTNFDMLEDYWEYYEGMLVKDTKQGRGKIKLTNGEIFEGDFHNDRIQGFGKFYTNQNSIIEGIWKNSRLIKIINT